MALVSRVRFDWKRNIQWLCLLYTHIHLHAITCSCRPVIQLNTKCMYVRSRVLPTLFNWRHTMQFYHYYYHAHFEYIYNQMEYKAPLFIFLSTCLDSLNSARRLMKKKGKLITKKIAAWYFQSEETTLESWLQSRFILSLSNWQTHPVNFEQILRAGFFFL